MGGLHNRKIARKKILPSEPPEGASPKDSDFGLLDSRTVTQLIYGVLSYQIGSNLL